MQVIDDLFTEAERILIRIFMNWKIPRTTFTMDELLKALNVGSSVDEKNTFVYIIDEILVSHKNYLVKKNNRYHIAPLGFENIHKNLNQKIESKTVFCAMWFDGSILTVWDKAIKPAVENAGYKPERVDLVHHNNDIIA